jgi:heme-degrading monooxygenase HmoA
MIGVLVTFRYEGDFDEERVRKIAETAKGHFEGMPGLRTKAFTIDSESREVINFYIWDSADAASAFFTEELVDRVAALYHARPTIVFVRIAALVENKTSLL